MKIKSNRQLYLCYATSFAMHGGLGEGTERVEEVEEVGTRR